MSVKVDEADSAQRQFLAPDGSVDYDQSFIVVFHHG